MIFCSLWYWIHVSTLDYPTWKLAGMISHVPWSRPWNLCIYIYMCMLFFNIHRATHTYIYMIQDAHNPSGTKWITCFCFWKTMEVVWDWLGVTSLKSPIRPLPFHIWLRRPRMRDSTRRAVLRAVGMPDFPYGKWSNGYGQQPWFPHWKWSTFLGYIGDGVGMYPLVI